jgi:hypothetical protein
LERKEDFVSESLRHVSGKLRYVGDLLRSAFSHLFGFGVRDDDFSIVEERLIGRDDRSGVEVVISVRRNGMPTLDVYTTSGPPGDPHRSRHLLFRWVTPDAIATLGRFLIAAAEELRILQVEYERHRRDELPS